MYNFNNILTAETINTKETNNLLHDSTKMNFGSDEFFSKLLACPSNADSLMIPYELATIIEHNIRLVAGKRRRYYKDEKNIYLNDDNIEQIVNNAYCKVDKGLKKFISDSSEKSEVSRNAWLKKIVIYSFYDFFRDVYNCNVTSLDDEEFICEIKDETVYEENIIEEIDKKNAVCQIIKSICTYSNDPKRILAFLYNIYICAFYGDNRKSGSTVTVAEEFNGRTVEYAYSFVKNLIRSEYSYVPEEVFAVLDARLEKVIDGVRYGDKKFLLTEREITNNCSQIKRKVLSDFGCSYETGRSR